MTGLIKSPKKNTLAQDSGWRHGRDKGAALKHSFGVNAQKRRRADDGDDEGKNENESANKFVLFQLSRHPAVPYTYIAASGDDILQSERKKWSGNLRDCIE